MVRYSMLHDQDVTCLARYVAGPLRGRDVTRRSGNELLLSLFPGIDMMGKGFELSGFCVVRGPDKIFGGDVREFNPPPLFTGIFGGSPCQDFSRQRRADRTGYGLEMIGEFKRIVLSCLPDWWLLENVPGSPDVFIPPYSWQRIDMRASEFGLKQSRLRHIQFGHIDGKVLSIERAGDEEHLEPCCMATEGKRSNRRDFEKFCSLQGLPPGFDLPFFRESAKYTAVGNGVPVPMAQALAEGIKNLREKGTAVCACSCGRLVNGRIYATTACRVRAYRRRQEEN